MSLHDTSVFTLERLRYLGLSGALLLLVGVFSPLATHPEMGAIRMLSTSASFAAGVILIIMALGCAVLSLVGRYRRLLLTGGMSLVLVVLMFITLQRQLAGAANQPDIAAQVADVAISWGWVVLFIGSITLIVTGYLGRAEDEVAANAPNDQSGGRASEEPP